MTTKHTPDSFWSRVKKTTSNECWLWQGTTNSTGYGSLSYQGRPCVAHRVAAYLANLIDLLPTKQNGKTEHVYVLHKCDNRRCCNPNHLFVGNYSVNQRDCYNKNRRHQPKGEKHSNARLTNLQAATIRHNYKAGATQTALAKEFGVSQRTISLIVRGETYK